MCGPIDPRGSHSLCSQRGHIRLREKVANDGSTITISLSNLAQYTE